MPAASSLSAHHAIHAIHRPQRPSYQHGFDTLAALPALREEIRQVIALGWPTPHT